MEVDNLTVTFRQDGQDVHAVKGVSFTLDRGETVALVGESGSGKSQTALSTVNLQPASARVGGSVTYDGRESWSPADPAESAALTAFHAHMRGDKGFGSALGPDAPAALAAVLADRALTLAPSPWRLGPPDRALIQELAVGAASAVAETHSLAPQDLEIWKKTRRSAKAVAIGHTDLLALPRDP